MPSGFTAIPSGIRLGSATPAGVAFGDQVVYRAAPPAPVDNPGRLTVTVARLSSRNERYTFTLTDADGINDNTGSFTNLTVNVTSRDGRTDRVTLFRVDANTWRGTRDSANDRWLQGTAVVTYVDATSGASHTITETYSLTV